MKGPAKNCNRCRWQLVKSLKGFVRGQGLTTDAITFKELNGVEYVYVTKHIQGKPALEVLTGLKGHY